jgi:hypothetical protein
MSMSKVTASDGSLSASDTFKLTINPVNDALIVAVPIADQTLAEDTPWTFQVPTGAFTDVDNANLTSVAMEFAFEPYTKRDDNVVDPQPALKRKEFKEVHCWEVTFEDLSRIAADLWPSETDAPKVKILKSAALKESSRADPDNPMPLK